MRDAIRNKLIKEVADLNDVYEPHAAGPDSKKPYAVIRQGAETEENDWVGFRRIIEVWPYVSRSTFSEVDDLQKKIIQTLDQQLVTDGSTGEAFSCIYLGTSGQDAIAEEWDAITRGLRFAVMALQHVESEPNIKTDPWITALSEWTSGFLDPSWAVYENQLPLGYKRPCVLWRLDTYQIEGVSRSAYKVIKQIVGHVISAQANQKIKVSSEIAERMTSEMKIPISVDDRKYMTVDQPRVDFKADELNTGQINASLSRKAGRPQESLPVMREVDHTGKLK